MPITGCIKDDTGTPIVGASIVLGDATGVPLHAGSLSNQQGDFYISSSLMGAGLYLQVSAEGYESLKYTSGSPF